MATITVKRKMAKKNKPVGECPGCGRAVTHSIFRKNKHWHPSCWKRKKRSWEN